jgi:predicted enzyme related to lactoylglutathione lyase
MHDSGNGPGDTHCRAYVEVGDVETALRRVRELGGEVIGPGGRWAVCRHSEPSPFGLVARTT